MHNHEMHIGRWKRNGREIKMSLFHAYANNQPPSKQAISLNQRSGSKNQGIFYVYTFLNFKGKCASICFLMKVSVFGIINIFYI